MYLLKTKGTDKITDFLEIRDNNFALIKYIKLNTLEKKIPELVDEFNLKTPTHKIISTINSTPFGQIIKID